MSELEDKIKARLAALEKERQEFVEMVNRQLSAYNAGINELKALLEKTEESDGAD